MAMLELISGLFLGALLIFRRNRAISIP